MHILANSHDYDDGNKQEQNETRRIKKKKKRIERKQRVQPTNRSTVCLLGLLVLVYAIQDWTEIEKRAHVRFTYNVLVFFAPCGFRTHPTRKIYNISITTWLGKSNSTKQQTNPAFYIRYTNRGCVFYLFSSFSNDGLNQIESCAVLALIFHFFK